MLFTEKLLNLVKSLNSDKDIGILLKDIDKISTSPFDVIVETGENKNLKLEKFNLLKIFWERYFKQTSLNLIEYGSASRSIISRQIKSYNKE